MPLAKLRGVFIERTKTGTKVQKDDKCQLFSNEEWLMIDD